MIEMPDADDVVQLHNYLVALFEADNDPISPPGVKSQALLESACGRPHVGSGSIDKYKTLEQKAAALFHSLTKNHAFHNGNKRTAIVTLLTVLYWNGRRLIAGITDDEIYNFVLSVTADEFPAASHSLDTDAVVQEIARWIRRQTESTQAQVGEMKVSEFLGRCLEAGANVKDSGPSWVVAGEKSVRIGKDTPKLAGHVVKRYLSQLGLVGRTGVGVEDFKEGAFEARDEVYRFMLALRRLAKT